MKMHLRVGCILLSLLVLTQCGYHLAGRGSQVPAGVRSIAIPVFKNETYEPAIEDLITEALIQEFSHHRWARITATGEADAVLNGTVKKFVTSPISFSSTDFAAEYRVRIKVKITLRDKDGTVIWEDKELSISEEFEVTTDIFVSEGNKRRAISKLSAELAEEVHDRIFDGF